MKSIVLVINPGSTSTKIALYRGEEILFEKIIFHTDDELTPYNGVMEQEEYRKELIIKQVKESGIKLEDIALVIGRGGLVKSIPSGVYEVNEQMKEDLHSGLNGIHASNLGGLIASSIANMIGVKAYIADPVVVDEMSELAHISGHPMFPRKSIFHALNQKAVAKAYAKSVGKSYEDVNVVVAHLGGGVSVGAHKKGLVVEVNNAILGDGPFSCDRCGSVAVGDVIDLAFTGEYSKEELKKMINGEGGFLAHLGSNNAKEIEKRASEGDKQYKLILDAFIYNIAKSIGSCSTAIKGEVDAIILTGGIAYNKYICGEIASYTKWIAPLDIHPGEDELLALAQNGALVLEGKIIPKIYC